MKKIFSSDDRFLVWTIKDQLLAAGFDCCIRNEYAVGGAGDLVPFDCWPEVWLINDAEYAAAEKFLVLKQAEQQQRYDWNCKYCGESNGAAFELCWKCGKAPSV